MNQTVKPDQWIVVDDGKLPMIPMLECHYLRRHPSPSDPKHTMTINLGVALQHVEGDFIIILEDDEYYAPGYVAKMAELLERYEVAGIGRSKYYHLPTGGFIRDTNCDNASFAQTAFRRSFVPEVRELIAGDQYVDMRIWKRVGNVVNLKWAAPETFWTERIINNRAIIVDDGDQNCLYVAMKALPGREGICWGHKAQHKYYKTVDHNREVLKRWMSPNFYDFNLYMNLLKIF